jgi:hypothetical protein
MEVLNHLVGGTTTFKVIICQIHVQFIELRIAIVRYSM